MVKKLLQTPSRRSSRHSWSPPPAQAPKPRCRGWLGYPRRLTTSSDQPHALEAIRSRASLGKARAPPVGACMHFWAWSQAKTVDGECKRASERGERARRVEKRESHDCYNQNVHAPCTSTKCGAHCKRNHVHVQMSPPEHESHIESSKQVRL